MGLFDVHAHLTHPTLLPHEADVLARARAAGVTSIISNGLNPSDNDAVRALAARSTVVRPAFGLYPVDAVLAEMEAMGVDYPRDCPPFTFAEAADWLRRHVHEAIAVGEIGLDGHWVPEALWPLQEERFRAMVEIAMAADKPMIVHTRKREARAFEILVEMGATRVDWHCFGGRVKLARRIADHGHFLSIPANARKNEAFTRMLETLPRDRVLLETDCPYLSPDRNEDNEPKNVRVTLEFAAELWGESSDRVLERLEQNYAALFGEPP
jgi:TatD DNase family protein